MDFLSAGTKKSGRCREVAVRDPYGHLSHHVIERPSKNFNAVYMALNILDGQK